MENYEKMSEKIFIHFFRTDVGKKILINFMCVFWGGVIPRYTFYYGTRVTSCSSFLLFRWTDETDKYRFLLPTNLS